MFERIVVLTGSGISAESGISTFRDKGGIWSKYKVEDVATLGGFERDPAKVLDFYNMRRRVHKQVRPNAAHLALSRLELEHKGPALVITQNVDRLHELAGSRNVIHMHGEAYRAWCMACDSRCDWWDDLDVDTPCPNCGATGAFRPNVVWFGETPYCLPAIYEAIKAADVFVAIGTSGTVYPAAGFVDFARRWGARTLEINLEASGSDRFDEFRQGAAGIEVPRWVDQMLAEKCPIGG